MARGTRAGLEQKGNLLPPVSLAGTLELAQSAAERLDFVFVGGLLPLGHFESLEHFFHLIKRLAQGVENFSDVLDRFLDGRRGSRDGWTLGWRRGVRPALLGCRPVRGWRLSETFVAAPALRLLLG